MTTVFIHHRVADYNTWRPEYDRAMTADWSKDIRAHRVWRGQDDPNRVIVASTFDSRQAAEAVMNNATLREAMGRGGVIQSSVRIDYVDEVAAGTR
jgi:heme-degrading monooxygenase HmoA